MKRRILWSSLNLRQRGNHRHISLLRMSKHLISLFIPRIKSLFTWKFWNGNHQTTTANYWNILFWKTRHKYYILFLFLYSEYSILKEKYYVAVIVEERHLLIWPSKITNFRICRHFQSATTKKLWNNRKNVDIQGQINNVKQRTFLFDMCKYTSKGQLKANAQVKGNSKPMHK